MLQLAPGGANSAMGGRNDAFAFDDDDAKANLLASGEDDFKGDANVDLGTGRISFVRGTFGRSKNRRGRGKGWQRQGRRLATTGTRTVVALNVVSSEGNTTGYSNAHLADSIFGALIRGEVPGEDEVNLVSQYSACSHKKLNFVPRTDLASTTPAAARDIVDGVATWYSTVSASSGDLKMQNDVLSKIGSAYGWQAGADHVIVCIPEAAWQSVYNVGYAYINWYISVYKDQW